MSSSVGSHSHRKEGLTPIPDTDTVIISPFQYLTYISKVELIFNNGVLGEISGEVVKMSNNLPEDPEVMQIVAQMQAELEADSDYAHLFQPIGEATIELSTEGQFTGEVLLGNLVTDIVRDAAQVHMAIFTTSGFRQPIPPGVILEQDLLTAMPYKNAVFAGPLQKLISIGIGFAGKIVFNSAWVIVCGLVSCQYFYAAQVLPGVGRRMALPKAWPSFVRVRKL